MSNPGHNESQPGQTKGVKQGADVEERTEPALTPDQSRTLKEHNSSITEHNGSITGFDVSDELAIVMRAWSRLPKEPPQTDLGGRNEAITFSAPCKKNTFVTRT